MLLAKITKQFNGNIECKDFLDNPTIQHTVLLLNGAPNEKEKEERVLIFNENCSKTILLFPPSMPLFGYTLIYKNLSQYLSDKYKVYMFTHFDTQDLLEDYVNQILSYNLNDVILMGYSFGGSIAFEIAHKLVQKNIRIKAIIFIDAYVAHKNRFKHLNADEDEYLTRIITDYLQKRSSQQMFRYNDSVTQALIKSYKQYHTLTKHINTTLKKLDVNIYQMQVDEPVKWIKDSRNEWSKLCRNYVVTNIVGDHSEILDVKNIKQNAETLISVLEEVELT